VYRRGPRRDHDRRKSRLVFESYAGHASTPSSLAGGIKTRREIAALDEIGMDAAVGMAMYKNRLR